MASFLIIVNILLILATIYVVWSKAQHTWAAKYWLPFVAAKLMAGAAVAALYLHYYGHGDLIAYMHDAQVYRSMDMVDFIVGLIKSDVPEQIIDQLHYQDEPRAIFMVKIVAVLNCLPNNVWLTSCNISLLSAIAIFYFTLKMGEIWPHNRPSMLLAFMFFPSVLFWGSGILKEAIAYPALLIIILPLLKILGGEKFNRIATVMSSFLALYILWQLKYYVVALLVPVLLATWATQRWAGQWPVPRVTVWLSAFIIPLAIASQLHPNLYPRRIAQVIYDNHQEIVKISSPRSIIAFDSLEPSVPSLLANMPKAIFTGLFRPVLGESNAILHLLAGVENTVLMLSAVLLLVAIGYRRWTDVSFHVVPVLVYVLLLAGLMALTSPNFGTLARYKIYYIPFVVFFVGMGYHLIWGRKSNPEGMK